MGATYDGPIIHADRYICFREVHFLIQDVFFIQVVSQIEVRVCDKSRGVLGGAQVVLDVLWEHFKPL